MKKYFLLFIAILVFVSVQVVAADEYDFRKARWGMSQEEVIRSESGKPVGRTSEVLKYKSSLDNKDCSIFYKFQNNRLMTGLYAFDIWHTNQNNYILDYGRLKELLIKKYGTPLDDEVIWSNDLFKNDHQLYGMAVAMGHLAFVARWETPTTEVGLMLTGENYEITLAIIYESKDLKEDPEKKDKEVLDQL